MNKHRTQKKRPSFSRTRNNLRQRYIARRKSVLLFQGQETTCDSDTSHAEKASFFFKDKKQPATAIHRT
ncbi:hypothetical protein [Virgibacillus proomii]|uniref:hypothetical protein n=1 Tax=Virgibacillus proomii TaxID=84407 RepID=UPI001C104B02|nr:hypothetical protein [Virgibacillus proomii]MBU5267660.1 hypothetical protein [Virgibacillus proomii]